MEQAFGIIIFVVVIGGLIIGLFTLGGSSKLYDEIGRGGLNNDREAPPKEVTPAVAARDRDVEIRQMVTARNERRARQGKAEVDVDAEVRRLSTPAAVPVDAGLRAEVRELVVARNARRERAGRPPLDVDEEVERQLRTLGH